LDLTLFDILQKNKNWSNIQDGYHSLDNKVQQLYYEQLYIYKQMKMKCPQKKAHVVYNWPLVATAAYPDIIIFFQIFLYVKSIPIILFSGLAVIKLFLEMLKFLNFFIFFEMSNF